MDASVLARADHAIARGHICEDAGDFEAALACYRLAVLAAPHHSRAHLNVGNALRALRDYSGAMAAFRRALLCDPDYAHGHFNIGTLYAEMGSVDEARRAFDRAVNCQPDEAMLRKVLDAESYLLFSSALRDVRDPILVARDHFRVGSEIARSCGSPFTSWANDPQEDRKLRVGYVSADLAPHPVSLFLRVVAEQQDDRCFEMYCYSTNPADKRVLESIYSNAKCIRDISLLTDRDAANLIRTDGIDILVDLCGHTQNNRLAIFAMHAAPVQATWLGYLNTTGLVAMDYRICDRFTDPEGETDRLHTEQLYRMPYSQWCYRAWEAVPPVAQPHPQSPDTVVFGSCNQHLKISESCLDLWCRILTRLPTAQLVVLDIRDRHARARITAQLLQRGIAEERITLLERLSISDYYRVIADFDIALDAYPHNGGTTTLDTIWMGVPLVGLRGKRGISRVTYSILSSLGMPELVADSETEYVDLNVRLAQDSTWRKALRSRMREQLAASPLMDAAQFTADIETAYRTMWRAWCSRTSRLPSLE